MNLRVGRLVRLRSDHFSAFLGAEGFTKLECTTQRFQPPPGFDGVFIPPKKNEQVFQIISAADEVPTPLFTSSHSSSSTSPSSSSSSAPSAGPTVDLEMRKFASVPRLLATQLESGELLAVQHEAELYAMIEESLASEPRIQALCVALEPSVLDREFALAVQRPGGAVSRSSDAPDPSQQFVRTARLSPMYEPSYVEWDWFTKPRELGKAHWTEPYVVGNTPVISYSVPIRQRGVIVGTVSMDILLDPKTKVVSSGQGTSSRSNKGRRTQVTQHASADEQRDDMLSTARVSAYKLTNASEAELGSPDYLSSILTELLEQYPHAVEAAIVFDPDAADASALRCRRGKHSDEAKLSSTAASKYAQRHRAVRKALAHDTIYFESAAEAASKRSSTASPLSTVAVPFTTSGANPRRATVVLIARAIVSVTTDQRVVHCHSCHLPCGLCYYRNKASLEQTSLCLRCFSDGLIPVNTDRDEFLRIDSRAYLDFIDKVRKPQTISYGQVIQMVHAKSARFLTVGLRSARSLAKASLAEDEVDRRGLDRNMYTVRLSSTADPDPYLQGTESTWFTVLPSSDVRSLGEQVREGDQIRLVSARWQWAVSFADPNARAPVTESASASRSITSSSVWRVVAYGTPDAELVKYETVRREHLGLPPFSSSAALEQTRSILSGEDEDAADDTGAQDDEASKHNTRALTERLGSLEPLSWHSPFLRDGDLIRLRSSTSSHCVAVEAVHYPPADDSESVPDSPAPRKRRKRRPPKRGDGQGAADPAIRGLHPNDGPPGHRMDTKYTPAGRFQYGVTVHRDDSAGAKGSLGDDKALHAVFKIEIAPSNSTLKAEAVEASGTLATANAQTRDVVQWSTRIRLRNVLSHRHLCVGPFTSSPAGYSYKAATVEEHDLQLKGAPNPEDVVIDFQLFAADPATTAEQDRDGLVTVFDPFYIAVAPPAQNKPASRRNNDGDEDDDEDQRDAQVLSTRRWWLNLTETSAAFTDFKNDEDAFVTVKRPRAEQSCIYVVRSSLKAVDTFVSRLSATYDPSGDNEQLYATEMAMVLQDELRSIKRVIADLSLFLTMAGNNSSTSVNAIISDPRHELAEATHLTVRWRQTVVLREHLVERLFAILSHPLFAKLVQYNAVAKSAKALVREFDGNGGGSSGGSESDEPTSETETETEAETETETELETDTTAGDSDTSDSPFWGQSRPKKQKKPRKPRAPRKRSNKPKETAAERIRRRAKRRLEALRARATRSSTRRLSAADHSYEQQQARELALDVYRIATKLCCLIFIDNSLAAVSAAAIPGFITHLLDMVKPSMVHRLGTQRLLALMFENGRKQQATMALSRFELERLLAMWTELLHDRRQLKVRVRELMQQEDAATDKMMVRHNAATKIALLTKDRKQVGAARNFLRLLCSLTTSNGLADETNQALLLESLLKQAQQLRDVSPEDRPDGTGEVLTLEVGSAKQPLHSLVPAIVHIVRSLSVGTDSGDSITEGGELLATVLGIKELRLSVEDLLAGAADSERSVSERAELIALLHELYGRHRLPKRIVDLAPLVGDLGAPVNAPLPADVMRHVRMTRPEAMAVFRFCLSQLARASASPHLNKLTLQVIKLVQSLLSYEYSAARGDSGDDDEEDERKYDEDGDAGALYTTLGPQGYLTQLGNYLLPLLRAKQTRSSNPQRVSDDEWVNQQRTLLDIKVEACQALDYVLDYSAQAKVRATLQIALNPDLYSPYRERQLQEAHKPLRPNERGSVLGALSSPSSSRPATMHESLELSGLAPRHTLPLSERELARVIELVRQRVFSEDNDIQIQGDLAAALIDLILDNRNTNLVMRAFALLQRWFARGKELVDAVGKCMPLQSDSMRDLVASVYVQHERLMQLTAIEVRSATAEDMDVDALHSKVSQVVEILDFIVQQMLDTPDVSTMRRDSSFYAFLHQQLGEDEAKEASDDPNMTGDMGIAGLDAPFVFSHSVHEVQHVLRVLDVQNTVLDILRMPLSVFTNPEHPEMLLLLERCYDVLTFFVTNNAKHKKKLEKHLDLFFSHVHLCLAPTSLLTGIIQYNRGLVTTLSRRRIQGYLEMLSARRDGSSPFVIGSPQCSWRQSATTLLYLKALVRVDKQLVRLNQTLVVKAICEKAQLLGHLCALDDDMLFGELVDLLNYVPKEDDVENEETRAKLLGKQYYLELFALLTRCAPARFVYVNDLAKREGEEAALLCQAALPVKNLLSLLTHVTDAASKMVVVRFLEQVYGPSVLASNPRYSVRLLRDFGLSIRAVTDHVELATEQRQRKTSALQPVHEAPGPHGQPLGDLDDEEDEEDGEAMLHLNVTEADMQYVFGVVLPFIVAYFNSSFRIETASKDEVEAAKRLFDKVVRLAHATRDATDSGAVSPEFPQRFGTFSVRSSMSMKSSSLSLSQLGIENVLNALMHMYDPQGRQAQECSGVMGVRFRSERRFRQLVAELESRHAQRLRRIRTSPEQVDVVFGQLEVASSTSRGLIHRVLPAFDEFLAEEASRFTALCDEHRSNRRLMWKVVLLVGEFSGQEKGVKHESGVPWIDKNSSRFIERYLLMLQHLVEMDDAGHEQGRSRRGRRLSMRKEMIALGLPHILIKLIPRLQSIKVLKASFSLANSLLKDGYHSAQMAFRRKLLSLGDNSVFVSIQNLLAQQLQARTFREMVRDGSKWSPERYGSWPLTQLVLRFLQLLTEGHNLHWQVLLNRQPLGTFISSGASGGGAGGSSVGGHVGVSINLVAQAGNFWSQLSSNSGPLYFVLVYWNAWFDAEVISAVLECSSQALDALIEVVQGPCLENQTELSRGAFIDSLNALMAAVVTSEEVKLHNDKLQRLGHKPDSSYGDWTPLEVEVDAGDATATSAWSTLAANLKRQARALKGTLSQDGGEEDDEGDDDGRVLHRDRVLLDFQHQLVIMLNALLEGRVHASVPSKLMQTVDFGALRRLLRVYLNRVEGQGDGDDESNPHVNLLASYFIFVKTLIAQYKRCGIAEAYSSQFAALLASKEFAACESRFGRLVGSVEIVRNGELEVVLFRIPRLVLQQSKSPGFAESKRDLLYSVRRENQYAKLDDFLRSSDELIHELTSYPKLKQTVLVRRFGFLFNITFFLAVALNLLSVYTNDRDEDSGGWGEPVDVKWMIDLSWVLGLVHIGFSVARFASYSATRAPKVMFAHRNEMLQELRDQDDEDDGSVFGKVIGGVGKVASLVGSVGAAAGAAAGKLLRGGEGEDAEDDDIGDEDGVDLLAEESLAVRGQDGGEDALEVDTATYVWAFISTGGALFELAYVVLSILGLAYPVLYCFLLLDIIERSPLLRQVMESLNSYRSTIAASGILWFILMYAFAAFGFAFFSDDFETDGVATCNTKFECVMLTFTEGIRAGGGVADVMNPNIYRSARADGELDSYFARGVFDVAYFVVVVVIMLSIVSGVVIDSFGNSRDHRQEVEEDQQQQCFICGVESSVFETHGGFRNHVRREHHMWTYVYFLAHLQTKDRTDYTGQESYVADLVAARRTDWMPIGRALALEDKEQEE